MQSLPRYLAIRVGALVAGLALIYGISVVDLGFLSGKSYDVERAEIDVEVQPDMALRVTERLRFDFNGEFRGAFRKVNLAKGVTATNIAVSEPSSGVEYRPGASAEEGSDGDPGTFGTKAITFGKDDVPRGFQVAWHYEAENEEREFLLSYDVEGVAELFEDFVIVEWAIWGNEWDFTLDDLEGQIRLASGEGEPILGAVAPTRLGGEVELGEGVVRTSVDRVDEETIFSAAFPRSAFDSTAAANPEERGSGTSLPIEQRADIYMYTGDEVASGSEKFIGGITPKLSKIGIGWTVGLIALTGLMLLVARERRSDGPRHVQEPPEELPPAVAYGLASEGEYDPRLVQATMLDLADRGFLSVETLPGKEMDLRIGKVAKEDKPDDQLLPYEKTTLEFFEGLLATGPCSLSQLANRIPKHSEKWRNRWTKLNDELSAAGTDELTWKIDLTRLRIALGILAGVGYAALWVLYIIRFGEILIPLSLTLVGMFVLFVLPRRYFKKLDPESRKRNAEWRAFARWTQDFPALDDDPPATLNLWRKIMVYAVAFGTADRVIASGRIPAPVMADATTNSYWLIHTGTGDSISSLPSFDNFGSSVSDQVTPQPSSSGGGGGGGGGASYSGGGGGSSGGGGGGAW